MATPATALPRFLLPQLTWKRSIPGSIAVTTCPVQTIYQHRSRPTCRRMSCQTDSVHEVHSPSLRYPQLRHRPSSARILPSSLLPRQPFHTTAPLYRDHHFDTLKFVSRLKEEGFSEEQATAMMRVLSDVIEESIQNLTRTMVLREGKAPVRSKHSPHFLPVATRD